MQNHFLQVAKGQVAVVQGQIADLVAFGLIAGSCLSALTLWMLSYRLAVVLLSR